jgi:hypothetical protein
MTHTTVLVPHGHTVTVHAPGAEIGVPHATGMIPNAATEGAKAAMDAALPTSQGEGSKPQVKKALTKAAGSAAAKGKPKGKTPAPRGGGD